LLLNEIIIEQKREQRTLTETHVTAWHTHIQNNPKIAFCEQTPKADE